MLAEITGFEVKDGTLFVYAEDLTRVVDIDNLFEDVDPEFVTFAFPVNDQFAMSTLDAMTRKMYQCGWNDLNKDGKHLSLGKRLEKAVGARTAMLPEKYKLDNFKKESSIRKQQEKKASK